MNKLFYIYVLFCATIFLASCESAVKDRSIESSVTISSNVDSATSEAPTSEPVVSESSSLPVQEVPSTTVRSKVSSSATSETIARSSAQAIAKTYSYVIVDAPEDESNPWDDTTHRPSDPDDSGSGIEKIIEVTTLSPEEAMNALKFDGAKKEWAASIYEGLQANV